MNDFIIYLLKVSAGLGIIFLPYYIVLRNDPNLIIKRFYLLTGVVAVWIIPLISFRKPGLLVNFTPTLLIDPGVPSRVSMGMDSTGSGAGLTIHWITVLIAAYFTGLAFLFLKNLFIVLKWNHSWQRNRNGEGVAFTRSDQVFTIFTRIFIPGSLKEEQDLGTVLLHEKAHIRQLHFVDLMLMEATLLLTWFNPFSWLISRMIKENHEHLADRQVLKTGIDPAHYRAQLLNHTLGVNVFRLGSQLNHSLTFKRFNMMKKPERSFPGIIKIALLVPLVLVSLGVTTGMMPQQKAIKGKVVLSDTGEPATGAAVVIRGTTIGTVADKQGAFLINVEGDPELVISYVGYATIAIEASKVLEEPIQLELKTYEMDLESVPLKEPPKETATASLDMTWDTKEPARNTGSISFRSSEEGDQEPVIILNGEVVTEIDNLDPFIIDHIEVIKDPDHELVKKYNAPEGVILITTKDEKTTGQTTGVAVVKPDSEDTQPDKEIFYVVEDMPMFPGGEEALKSYIYTHLDYPENAKKNGITGDVLVQFTVATSGKLEDIRVVRSAYAGFDQPAMEVFRGMPDWNPGKQRGKPVKVQVVVPVKFETENIILDQ